MLEPTTQQFIVSAARTTPVAFRAAGGITQIPPGWRSPEVAPVRAPDRTAVPHRNERRHEFVVS